MLGYFVRRVLSALVVIICVVFVVSTISKLVPGDIVDMMEAGNPGMTEQDKAALREQLGGLDLAAPEAAAALRESILQGAWGELLPGEHELARRLGVSRPTVRAALARRLS